MGGPASRRGAGPPPARLRLPGRRRPISTRHPLPVPSAASAAASLPCAGRHHRRQPRLSVPLHVLHDHQRAGPDDAGPRCRNVLRQIRRIPAGGPDGRPIDHYFFTDDNFSRNPQWEADARRPDRAARRGGHRGRFHDAGGHRGLAHPGLRRQGGARRLRPGVHRHGVDPDRQPRGSGQAAEPRRDIPGGNRPLARRGRHLPCRATSSVSPTTPTSG